MRARILSLMAASCAAVLVAGAAAAHEGHGGGAGGHQRHGDAPAEKTEKADKADKGGPATVTEGNFYPSGEEGSRVFGYAKMVRHDQGTDVTVQVSGLRRDRAHPVHVHSGPCRVHGPHYKHDPDGPGEPPNELWPSSDPDDPRAGLVSDGEGHGTARATASWTARPEAASVMLHDPRTDEMMACADLH